MTSSSFCDVVRICAETHRTTHDATSVNPARPKPLVSCVYRLNFSSKFTRCVHMISKQKVSAAFNPQIAYIAGRKLACLGFLNYRVYFKLFSVFKLGVLGSCWGRKWEIGACEVTLGSSTKCTQNCKIAICLGSYLPFQPRSQTKFPVQCSE